MPERNIGLLQETMQYILDHPDQHDQSTFVNECGTSACFAGWAALLSDWRVQRIERTNAFGSMWVEGAKLLGITYEEADLVFSTGNTIPMLELMVKDLVNGDELRDRLTYVLQGD